MKRLVDFTLHNAFVINKTPWFVMRCEENFTNNPKRHGTLVLKCPGKTEMHAWAEKIKSPVKSRCS
jgi:hypothetical protein